SETEAKTRIYPGANLASATASRFSRTIATRGMPMLRRDRAPGGRGTLASQVLIGSKTPYQFLKEAIMRRPVISIVVFSLGFGATATRALGQTEEPSRHLSAAGSLSFEIRPL